MRPLAWVAIGVVVVPAVLAHPAPGASGSGLAVAASLVAYSAGIFLAVARERAGAAFLIGAAGIALAALQPHGLVEVAPAVAVYICVRRLPLRAAAVFTVAMIVGLDLAIALRGDHAGASVAASTLLCLVLAVAAYSVRQTAESRDRAELLLAQLEDAHEAEQAAAAVAERGRIARELHDVLAHSLSALTIQLEGARLLARREGAPAPLEEAVARASELAKEGLADARRAVGALRGEPPPGVDDLPQLVSRFRQLELEVTLAVDGTPRPLSPDTGLALYRAAQEALTNALRYAPGARTTVGLRYGEREVALTVEDDRSGDGRAAVSPLIAVGGGKGLAGMRERVETLGGTMQAGGTGAGFRVEVEVPA